jgi:hypothetical protein
MVIKHAVFGRIVLEQIAESIPVQAIDRNIVKQHTSDAQIAHINNFAFPEVVKELHHPNPICVVKSIGCNIK